ncbi:MAG: hypothetical protein AAF702_04475 [Chloroflexota bacterium]
MSAAQGEPPQPTGLAILHRSGQTFITWTERDDLSGEMYRIYRHDQPVTGANLGEAAQLYEVSEGSARFFANRYRSPEGIWQPRYVDRFVIEPDGPQIGDNRGLLVWTLAPQDFDSGASGSSYYAVTTVENGSENRTDFTPPNAFGNTSGEVAEQVADPQPIRLSSDIGAGGHAYIQYMDLRRWNPTFHAPNWTNEHYGLDPTTPAVANALQYAYDYVVYEPSAESCEGTIPEELPLFVSLHGWTGNNYPPFTENPDALWCSYAIYPYDISETWYFGFAQNNDYRPGTAPEEGDTIINYTEQRILRMIYDLVRNPPGPAIDRTRVYLFGHSMGGSGTLAFTTRYANVFAASYASQPMTNYRTSSDDGGSNFEEDIAPKWGSSEDNLPILIDAPNGWSSHLQPYNSTGVWDWQNHQQNLRLRQADEMVPFGVAHGRLDTIIHWSNQAQPAYAAFNASRKGWGGVVVNANHRWLGFQGLPPNLQLDELATPFAGFQVILNESIPGLSNASNDSDLPPERAGGYNQTIRWSASWDEWDGAPVDLPNRWQISLCSVDAAKGNCGSGTPQTVDVTPRRLQNFVVQPGANYTWVNRNVADDSQVASGMVTADEDGVVTVLGVAVSPMGNRLILKPVDAPQSTSTSNPIANPTLNPEPTSTNQPTVRPTTQPFDFCSAYHNS